MPRTVRVKNRAEYQNICKYLKEGNLSNVLPTMSKLVKHRFTRKADLFTIINDKLYLKCASGPNLRPKPEPAGASYKTGRRLGLLQV